MPYGRFFLFLPLTALLAGCAMQRAQDAETAQRHLVGKTKEQIFACMGIPKRKGVEGGTEIWSYDSGNGQRDKTGSWANVRYGGRKNGNFLDSLGESMGVSEDTTVKRFCTVQVVMSEGHVRDVHYNGPTGGFLTDDEQCAYAIRNCLPR